MSAEPSPPDANDASGANAATGSPASTAATTPPGTAENSTKADGSALRWNAWNLLLLLPLLMLVTPWFNQDQPRLGGIPFFYWYQVLFVVVGVACVWIVHLMTRTPRTGSANGSDNGSDNGTELVDQLSVDQLDEGEAR